MKRKFSKIQIGLIALAALALVAVAVFFIFFPREKEDAAKQGILLHLPNYEEDIFLNKAYLSFTRDLRYGQSGVEQLYSYETDFDDASAECKFFLSYFHTVIYGDTEKYPDYFVEGYFETDPKFTMQMIYEPYVLFHSASEEEIEGKTVTLFNFQVSYKIFKNNGTFRNDISSNTAVPQIYQLQKDPDGSYRIFRILDIKTKDGD